MASPYKVTMYYSDESTRLFLKEARDEYGGKKSDSNYLYSLVTREREKTERFAEERKSQSEHVVTSLLPNFLNKSDFFLSGVVTFPSFKNSNTPYLNVFQKSAPAMERKYNLKNLQNFLQCKVQEDFKKRLDQNSSKKCPKTFYVIIIKHISCYYADPSLIEGMLIGNFHVEYTAITVDPNLWDKHGGKYRFDKIKYWRYESIFNSGKKTLRKIREETCRDKEGGYFIPVTDKSMPFPKPSKNRGNIIIIGGESRQSRARFDCRKIPEERINRNIERIKKLIG